MLIGVGHSHGKKTVGKDPAKWEMSPQNKLPQPTHYARGTVTTEAVLSKAT